MSKKQWNPLWLVSRLPFGRRTLWKMIAPLTPTSMKEILVDVHGVRMYLDVRQDLDLLYALGIYDKPELEFLLGNCEPGGVFVDGGANQGLYSLLFAKRRPDATIVAFEPDPLSIAKLEKNVQINSLRNITICPYALSDSDESKDLMVNTAGSRGGNSFVVSQLAWQAKEEKIKVPCKTLLSAMQANHVATVGAMKLDLEGYEYPVLRAFFRAAPSNLWPKRIVVEAFGHVIALVGGSPIELLIAHGYTLVDHAGPNYFFVRS